MKVFILLSVFAVAFAGDTECGPDSHYESCGTACPLTCDNYNDPPKACVLMCNPGCQCNEGFVKSFEGRCVRPYQCPMNATQCDAGSHYESCGTACPLTCDNYADPPKACVLMCKPGCQCDEGYVKSFDGFCIRPFQCPLNATKCGANSHYESCGTACPLTCDNYDKPPKACILMCNPGCHCDEGFVKSFEGRCVRPFQCPMEDTDKCGENERYTKCGTACPLTCDNYNNPPKICPLMCKIGCECEDGFVRRSDGRCVRREECSSRTESAEACDMPAETGVCRGFFPRFYFDRTTGQCQKFVYGGCGGNENNFETIEDCQQQCSVQSVPEVCSLEAEVGFCFGYFPRYYYNKEKARCQKFIFGGCGGNGNNFKTLEECHQICVA